MSRLENLSYVCSDFDDFCFALLSACVYLPQSAAEEAAHMADPSPLTKSACSPSGVEESYETYYRTPLPLLVRNWWYVCGGVARNSRNISKTQLKKH